MVGERTWLGLLPSEEKLLAHRERLARGISNEGGEGGDEGLLVYEDAPVMRPIVFLGPSSNDSEVSESPLLSASPLQSPVPLPSPQLTELLQKALVSFMKEQFSGRLHEHTPQWSIAKWLTDKQGKRRDYFTTWCMCSY